MTIARIFPPRLKLEISRIGLGLAAVHLQPEAVRRRLLDTALELGMTHLDAARFYGDGLAENFLGRALGGRRSGVTVATKFGLLPTPLLGRLGRAAWPLRKGRGLLRKLGLIEYPKHSYTLRTMRRELHASLRALRTDYIDLYFLHEPMPGCVVEDGLIEALLEEKRKGTVRRIGVAGWNLEVLARFGDALDVLQTAEGSWAETDASIPDITYSLFSSKPVATPEGRLPSPRERLERALNRRPDGAVLVQTGNPDHLRELAAWSQGN